MTVLQGKKCMFKEPQSKKACYGDKHPYLKKRRRVEKENCMPIKYDFDVRPLRVPVIIVKRRTIDLPCLPMTGI